jgi:AraC-like DNA-binding protein
MTWEVLVSLVNAATGSVALLGCLMFIATPAYRGICVLLALVCVAALTNIFEDLGRLEELHLISPIFVLAYGPALYVAVRRLTKGPFAKGRLGFGTAWHFLPMLLVLPFTAHTQTVIALGTAWRLVYALFTLKLIMDFNKTLTAQRSDASEVSLAWLGWLIAISTLFSALDLVRLNLQLELGEQLNMSGYALSSLAFFVVLLLLILILNSRRAALEALAKSLADTSLDGELSETTSSLMTVPAADTSPKKAEELAADYQQLFAILEQALRAQSWYRQPRLTLNQLSELSGILPRDISRSINLVAGISFNDYINQHRIEQVKQALVAGVNNKANAKSSINLTDLAFAAGFSSKATFNQAFKRETGMTPSEYRTSQYVQNHAFSRLEAGD